MKKYLLILALTSSFNCNAALVQNTGFFTDTIAGRDWMHVVETTGLTYNQILSDMVSNGQFSGWNVATSADIANLWSSLSDTNWNPGVGLTDPTVISHTATLIEHFGTSETDIFPEDSLALSTTGLLLHNAQNFNELYLLDVFHDTNTGEKIYERREVVTSINDNQFYPQYSYALYRNHSPVPVPAAVWFMGSGLFGLMGFSRKRKYCKTRGA